MPHLDVPAIKALIRSATSRYRRILKWDRNQPRGPKGTKEGGRWVKDVSMGAGSAPAVSRGASWDAHPTQRRQEMLGPASYADIMNAPMGTGFGNRPRLTGDPEMVQRLKPPPAPPSAKTDPALTSGSVESVKKKFGGSANAAFLVEMEDGTKAVYKPESGETFHGSFTNGDISEYITNEAFSLAEREAMASEVSFGLGYGELVPETHLRENLKIDGDYDVDEDEDGGGGYDEDYVRELYDEYKERAQEDAMDAVGGEMSDLYAEAQKEHVSDIERRVEEVQEIWDELAEDSPVRAQQEADRAHPNLPMGSQASFHRQTLLEDFDPLELLDEAGIDVTGTLNETEKEKVRAVLQQRLDEGYRGPGELDEKAAREHLDYDQWIQDHADTEGRLYDEKFKSFDSWRHDNGYDSNEGGGGRGSAPGGTGSLQRYVPGDMYGSPSNDDRARMAVLDYVLGTMDRHGGNLLFKDDVPVAIDNGYSMPGPDGGPDRFMFRSGIVREWLDRGVLPSSQVRTSTLDAMAVTDWKAMADRHPNMSVDERAAFLGRVENMQQALATPGGLISLWRRQNLMR